MALEKWSTTAGNNVNANTGINWDEQMPPSQVNDSARSTMADLRDWYENQEWPIYGRNGSANAYSISFVSTTVFKFAGTDRRTLVPIGRRVKAGVGAGTIYGTCTDVTLSASDTQATVSWDSGQLDNSLSYVALGVLSPANESSAPRAGGHIDNGTCEGRLTLTSGSPVTTADVTGATTVYFTAYKGNRIALYNGSRWQMYGFSESSVSIPSTSSTCFDVFAAPSAAGAVSLETVNWSSDTARATALTTQNGVYVKNGDATRRYLGTLRTTGTLGQTEDSLAKRYVWNYYHRIRRQMLVNDTTNSWPYTLGVGVDSTSANSAQLFGGADNVAAGARGAFHAMYSGYPGVGRHTLVWLEFSFATGTTTWYGDNGGTGMQSGIHGEIFS